MFCMVPNSSDVTLLITHQTILWKYLESNIVLLDYYQEQTVSNKYSLIYVYICVCIREGEEKEREKGGREK